jgi:hypothetical protein
MAEAMALPAATFYQVPDLLPLLRYSIAPETLNSLMANTPPRVALTTIETGLEEAGRIAPYWQEPDDDRGQASGQPGRGYHPNRRYHSHQYSPQRAHSDQIKPFQRIESVALEFAEARPIMLQGRSRILYSKNHTIGFPLRLQTPRPIHQAKLCLVLKCPKTGRIVLRQTYPALRNLASGPLSFVPTLTPRQLAALAGQEYLVYVALLWRGRSRRTGRSIRVGTSMTQLVTLVEDYCFDRIAGAGETIQLNDVTQHRPYWHKVWQGTLREDMRRLSLECKYYYALEDDRPNNARMETMVNLEMADSTRQVGTLKTGMILSPYRLNDLMQYTTDYPALDEEELDALTDSQFRTQFSHLAQTQVKFRGRLGDGVALWVYPELQVQRILLKRVARTDRQGQVLELADRVVHFPLPTVAHFIGTGNGSDY